MRYYEQQELNPINIMRPGEEFTYQRDDGKFISGVTLEVHDTSYIVRLLGQPHTEIPKVFFNDLKRIS